MFKKRRVKVMLFILMLILGGAFYYPKYLDTDIIEARGIRTCKCLGREYNGITYGGEGLMCNGIPHSCYYKKTNIPCTLVDENGASKSSTTDENGNCKG